MVSRKSAHLAPLGKGGGGKGPMDQSFLVFGHAAHDVAAMS